MPDIIPNPFPINIVDKIDSWAKLQQLANVDISLKYTADEFNKIKDGLEWLYNNSFGEYLTGTVPAIFKRVIIDHTTDVTSDLSKMVVGINALPNYILDQGGLYYFTNNRLVLTNGSYGIPRPGGTYTVVTDFYVLVKRIDPDAQGNVSVGVDGTPVNVTDIKFLFSIDGRSDAPYEYDLGDIGTDEINEAVNVAGPYSTSNGVVSVFTALQNGESESWLYLGNDEAIGVGEAQTVLSDYKQFGEDDLPPNYQETLPSSSENMLFGYAVLNNHEGSLSYMKTPTLLNSFVTRDHVVGGFKRVHISTVGKTAFPTVTSSVAGTVLNQLGGSDFAADEFFDLFIECVFVDQTEDPPADLVNYFFINRAL